MLFDIPKKQNSEEVIKMKAKFFTIPGLVLGSLLLAGPLLPVDQGSCFAEELAATRSIQRNAGVQESVQEKKTVRSEWQKRIREVTPECRQGQKPRTCDFSGPARRGRR